MSALVRRGAPLVAAVLAFVGVGIAAAVDSGPPPCTTVTTVVRPKHQATCTTVAKSRNFRR